MTKISLFLFWVLLFFITAGNIQGQTPEFLTGIPPATFNISYHGNNLWNPGLNAGVEQSWSLVQRINKRSRPVVIEKFFNADIGFFRDYSRQTPVFTHVGINSRRYRVDKNSFHYQIGFSPVGIYRAFLPETWEYTVNGTVEKVLLPGRFYYAPVVSMGIGRYHQNQPGTGWFVELNITTLIPYNTYIMPLLNIKAGYRIPLKKQIVNIKTTSDHVTKQ